MGADPVDPRFRLGINYWPMRTAMRWWSEFVRAEVDEDFARIAGGGFDSVRCFLFWEAFQPAPDRVDSAMLERLVAVADAAEHAGLAIVPTLFAGHMSGVDWIPGWALGGTERDARFRVVSGGRVVPDGVRNWYADPDIARAQSRLAGEAAVALAGHPALWAWDLGNENSNCTIPPDREDARRWLAGTTGAIRAADPEVAVTIGIHMEDLEEDRRLGPAEAADACDFLTMHGYPIYAPWSDGPTDAHLVPFLARITRWLGGGADVMFSEFGCRPHLAGSLRLRSSPRMRRRPTRTGAGRLRLAGCTGAMLCATATTTRGSDRPSAR